MQRCLYLVYVLASLCLPGGKSSLKETLIMMIVDDVLGLVCNQITARSLSFKFRNQRKEADDR